MVLRIVTLVGIFAVIPVVAGCGRFKNVCCPVDSHTECPAIAAEVTGARDLQAEVLLQSYDQQPPVPEVPIEYLVLPTAHCQCTAANNDAVANMLQMEYQLIDWSTRGQHGAALRNLLMQRDLVGAQSVVKRNSAAALAMKTFYGLAGVEAQAPLLAEAVEEIITAERRAKQLHDEGLAEDINVSALVSQRLELEEKANQLRLTRKQLNMLLQKLLDCPLNQQTYFWPETTLVAEPSDIDIDFEVSRGLELRAELRAVRATHYSLDTKTLPVARGVLQTADAALGSATETRGLRLIRRFADAEQEVAVRDRQLATLTHDTEQTVGAEIRRAVDELETTRRYLTLASAKLVSRDNRLKRLEVQRRKGTATAIDVNIANVQRIEAKSEVLNHVVALRVAEISLKQAQGLLAQECGYEAIFCCE